MFDDIIRRFITFIVSRNDTLAFIEKYRECTRRF